jgi:hypothetical protein
MEQAFRNRVKSLHAQFISLVEYKTKEAGRLEPPEALDFCRLLGQVSFRKNSDSTVST